MTQCLFFLAAKGGCGRETERHWTASTFKLNAPDSNCRTEAQTKQGKPIVGHFLWSRRFCVIHSHD
jgi:hypothetical protein